MVNINYQPTTLSSGWNNSALAPQGIILHSTAWPGMDAQGIRDYFNAPNRGASIHAAVDDKTIIQCMPWTKRAGHVGRGAKGTMNNTHIGIEMCEPAGLTYNSGGWAIISYEPDPGYFPKVWQNSVELFAHLCREFGLDPLADGVILSHAEAHARGYGDNHGDTAHWFKWENKTMDDFRQEVRKKMNEGERPLGNSGEWSDEACAWAVKNGLFVGNGAGDYNWEQPMTREAMAVVLHRYHENMGD